MCCSVVWCAVMCCGMVWCGDARVRVVECLCGRDTEELYDSLGVSKAFAWCKGEGDRAVRRT